MIATPNSRQSQPRSQQARISPTRQPLPPWKKLWRGPLPPKRVSPVKTLGDVLLPALALAGGRMMAGDRTVAGRVQRHAAIHKSRQSNFQTQTSPRGLPDGWDRAWVHWQTRVLVLGQVAIQGWGGLHVFWSSRSSSPTPIHGKPMPPSSWQAVKELAGVISSPVVARGGGLVAAICRAATLAVVTALHLQGALQAFRPEAALVGIKEAAPGATKVRPTVVQAALMATEEAVLAGVGRPRLLRFLLETLTRDVVVAARGTWQGSESACRGRRPLRWCCGGGFSR